VLVLCVAVVAFYAAVASFIAWPTIVYQHGRSRAALDTPISVASRGEISKDRSSPTEQTSPVLAAYEAPTKPVLPTAKSAPAVLPESHELTWVTVLLPARGSYRSFSRHSHHPFLRGWNTPPRHALLERLD